MTRILIFIIISVSFISCVSDTKVPSNILQPDQMTDILWDIMRSQTLAYEISRKDSLVKESAEVKVLAQKIFQIYKIDSAYFNKSYNWYVAHPVVFKTIFDSMYVQKEREDRLKNMEDTTVPQ